MEVMLDIYEFRLFHFLLLTLENGKQLLVFLEESPNGFQQMAVPASSTNFSLEAQKPQQFHIHLLIHLAS